MPASVLFAYVTVSLVWGSTYLAIRIGVQYVPPALFGGIRFVTAGAILLIAARLMGHRLPTRPRDWRTAVIVGVLLLTFGNGAVIWAEQFVESGMAAVLVVTGALWMAVLDAVIPGSEAKPTAVQFLALISGFGGVVLLVAVSDAPLGAAGLLGPVGLVTASGSWALGSIYSKRNPSEASPYMNAALQMLVGGGALLLIGFVAGEASEIHFSWQGFGAIAYLIVFGSLVAYTSFVYLLKHAPAAFVGTHNYVNTVVAVLLGWLILDEHVNAMTFVAVAIVLGSVLWVRRAGAGRPHPAAPAAAVQRGTPEP
jgi:drug/metabolite transporter (DMT)-like permease